MENFDEKIAKHIEKVMAVQNNEMSAAESLQQLKEIDLELGISPQEWDLLMSKADESAKLARQHLLHQNYTAAYEAADWAISVNPFHKEGLLGLAQAAWGLYKQTQEAQYLVVAKQKANELLLHYPNEQAAVILLSQMNQMQQEQKSKKRQYLWVALGLLLVVGLLFYVLNRPNTALKNQLIDSQESANAAWAQVENVITRRDQMLPQLLALAPTNNAAATELKHEIEQLSDKIQHETDLNQKIALQAELQQKIKLFSVLFSTENDEKTKLILIQIEGSYNRVSVEAMRYNEAAKQYNTLLKKSDNTFPEFQEKPYFVGK